MGRGRGSRGGKEETDEKEERMEAPLFFGLLLPFSLFDRGRGKNGTTHVSPPGATDRGGAVWMEEILQRWALFGGKVRLQKIREKAPTR